jgi:hypothetical protein
MLIVVKNIENVLPCVRFPLFALICQLVGECERGERGTQKILLGAISPLYCVILSVSIHLETESMERVASSGNNPWVFPLETNNPI